MPLVETLFGLALTPVNEDVSPHVFPFVGKDCDDDKEAVEKDEFIIEYNLSSKG